LQILKSFSRLTGRLCLAVIALSCFTGIAEGAATKSKAASKAKATVAKSTVSRTGAKSKLPMVKAAAKSVKSAKTTATRSKTSVKTSKKVVVAKSSKYKTSRRVTTRSRYNYGGRARIRRVSYVTPSHYSLTRNNVQSAPVLAELPIEMGSPIENLMRSELQDSFFAQRSGQRVHHAIDIFRPVGAPLLAVVDGTVEKMFSSRLGGITLYLFDESRNYCFYYAHLDRYAEGLKEGTPVKKGDVIGYVGKTGNAMFTAPHLHFQIMKTDPSAAWWKDAGVLNPFPLLVQVIEKKQEEIKPAETVAEEVGAQQK
jgi:peptidoglycan LD-endopeptidase LytH